MQHDILNSKLKPFFYIQIARQEREKMTKSRNRWRIAALVFIALFAVESCAPDPVQHNQNVEQK